jgi:hypothetical protein
LTTKAFIAAALADGFLYDQQIRGKTDALPAEEHLDEVVRRHQHQHREGEERQIGEEARPMRIVVHVADRIDVNERRDRVHDDEHHRRQRVDPQRPGRIERTGLDEAQYRHGEAFRVAERDLKEGDPGENRRDHQETGRHIFRRLGADRAAAKARDQEAEKRKKDDGVIHEPLSPSSD